jgi:uncharacterized protein
MNQDRVYIADPARGNLRMSIGRFLDEWHGVVFVLEKAGDDKIISSALSVPDTLNVQPELARFNGLIDLGMLIKTLPQR